MIRTLGIPVSGGLGLGLLARFVGLDNNLLWNTTLTTLIEQMHGGIGEMIQKANQHKMMVDRI